MTAMAHIVMWKLAGATAQERHAQAQDLVQGFEAYGAHPEHLKVKAMMSSLRTARSQPDFELAGP